MSYDLIQMRGFTTAFLGGNDVVLADREIAKNTTTGEVKIGDGVKKWSELPVLVTVSSTGITDSTTVGRAVLTAANAAAARSAIGAGESNLVIGITGSTAMAGNTPIPTLPTQVSSGEKTAGTETGLRSFSPKDVADMAGTHGGGGGSGFLPLAGGTMTGAIAFAGGQTWPTFNQNTTGSAATLTTARTLTIGDTGKTFNGGANVSWTLAEIGAAPANATLTDAAASDTLPSTSTSTLASLLQTARNCLKSLTTTTVRLTGAQTVAGVKTFSNRLVAAGAYTASATPTHSATPTFDCAASNVFEPAAMTSNITSITLSNAVAGQVVNIRCQQDGTGGRTVAAPSGAKITGSMPSAANAVGWLTLIRSSRGSRWEGYWNEVAS